MTFSFGSHTLTHAHKIIRRDRIDLHTQLKKSGNARDRRVEIKAFNYTKETKKQRYGRRLPRDWDASASSENIEDRRTIGESGATRRGEQRGETTAGAAAPAAGVSDEETSVELGYIRVISWKFFIHPSKPKPMHALASVLLFLSKLIQRDGTSSDNLGYVSDPTDFYDPGVYSAFWHLENNNVWTLLILFSAGQKTIRLITMCTPFFLVQLWIISGKRQKQMLHSLLTLFTHACCMRIYCRLF